MEKQLSRICGNNDVAPEESSKRRKCRKINYSKYFDDFTSNTSLHGLKYTGERHRTLAERIWWGIMVFISFCLCVFLILKVWDKWNQSPVIVTFSEVSLPIWQIPFPAVTLCPVVKTDLTKYRYYEMCDDTIPKTDEDHDIYHMMTNLCIGDCLNEMIQYYYHDQVALFLKVVPSLNDTIDRCYWDNMFINCDEIFKPFLTEEGVCFTNNMVSPSEIYSDIVDREKEFDVGIPTSQWHVETGYPKGAPLDAFPYRAESVGATNGLDIYLKSTEPNSDPKCNGEYEGYKISLHAPNSVPRTTENFFWVPLNVDTMVTIKPSMLTTSETLRSYSPARKLKYFKEYELDNCHLECMANLTFAACKCFTLGQPHEEDDPLCGEATMPCVDEMTKIYYKLEILERIEGNIAEAEIEGDFNIERLQAVSRHCDCLPACTSISYDYSVSQNKLKTPKNITVNDTEILTRVVLFFDQTQFMPSKRSELYGITDFLANCGGLLGVCLGFSILSLVEVIYFFVFRFLADLWNGRYKKPKNNII